MLRDDVAQVRYRADRLALSATMLFAQSLVLRVIVYLGGCGPQGDLCHGHFVATFKADFKDDVSLLPLATCRVG
jgi:hypothetical protein